MKLEETGASYRFLYKETGGASPALRKNTEK